MNLLSQKKTLMVTSGQKQDKELKFALLTDSATVKEIEATHYITSKCDLLSP